MLLCKTCIDNKIIEWKKPFDEGVVDPQRIPEYYETMQHVWDFDVAAIATKLSNGEMLEVLCSSCKLTHVGKDVNGIVKIRHAGDPEGQWTDYTA